MVDTTSPPSIEHFDADTLKELRESARVYQKLDFVYLAAGGAIVTALKLNSDGLLEFAAQIWAVVIAFVILLAVDTFIEQFVFSEWIAAKTNANKRYSVRSVRIALDIQPFLHLVFLGGVIFGVLGFSMGVTSVRDTLRAQAEIQNATELFVAKKQRPPASIEELIFVVPYADHLHKVLNHQPIHFETDNKESYKIIFADEDGVLGTADDQVVTSAVKLKNILSDLEAKECK
ncbi:MAG: hypothetical protein Q7T29_10575 [Gallionella sp.]|nr:hypothetical protein [Gallionella sp.]